MKKTKTQKGITLVALIITIVILLILSAVAISSIQENGLVEKTNGVVDKWNQAEGKEQGILNGYGDILNQYGTNNSGENISDLEMMKRYVMGKEGTGRSGLEIANLDMSTYTITSFKDDPETITDASTTVTRVSQEYNENRTKGIVYARYKNIIYKIVADMATFFTESVEVSVKLEDTYAIFEGEFTLSGSARETIPTANFMSPTRKYKMTVGVNGVTTTVYSEPMYVLNGVAVGWIDCGVCANENMIANFSTNEYVIYSIYDVGPSETYLEENGFGVLYNSSSETWILCATPNTSYIVPETVDGKTVGMVVLDAISGIPTFTKTVNLNIGADVCQVDGVKITTSDQEFINTIVNRYSYPGSTLAMTMGIDLTECGDDITIPEEALSSDVTIYVTSAVKAKYPDDSNVVAK